MKNKIKQELAVNTVIEQLEEVGKINIDYLEYDLELLAKVLEEEYNIKTEIQNRVGATYLVRVNRK